MSKPDDKKVSSTSKKKYIYWTDSIGFLPCKSVSLEIGVAGQPGYQKITQKLCNICKQAPVVTEDIAQGYNTWIQESASSASPSRSPLPSNHEKEKEQQLSNSMQILINKRLSAAARDGKQDVCKQLIQQKADVQTRAVWIEIADGKVDEAYKQTVMMLLQMMPLADARDMVQYAFGNCVTLRNLEAAKFFLSLGAKERFGQDLFTLLELKARDDKM